MNKIIVIDTSDPYYTHVDLYKDEESMLKGVQDKEVADLSVYEIKRAINLEKRPSVVLSD